MARLLFAIALVLVPSGELLAQVTATPSATSGPSVSPSPVLVGENATATITVQATPPAAFGEQNLVAGTASLQCSYTWKRNTEELVSNGPGTSNSDSHTFSTDTSGNYTIHCEVTVSGTADYKDPNNETHTLNLTGTASFNTSLQVDDYQVTVQVKSQVSGAYSSSASIAASGHNSAPHIADVQVTVTDGSGNAVSGKSITPSLSGGDGAAGTAAALDLSGTTDSNGQVTGTLLSSDRTETATITVTQVAEVSLGTPPTATVSFDWGISNTWTSEPDYLELGSGNTETLTLTWNSQALQGHDIRFWITKVHLTDGTEVGYQTSGLYATITNQPGLTDSEGTVTATITCHSETWDDWEWLQVTWWDFSVND